MSASTAPLMSQPSGARRAFSYTLLGSGHVSTANLVLPRRCIVSFGLHARPTCNGRHAFGRAAGRRGALAHALLEPVSGM
jgi:hypothetical protein